MQFSILLSASVELVAESTGTSSELESELVDGSSILDSFIRNEVRVCCSIHFMTFKVPVIVSNPIRVIATVLLQKNMMMTMVEYH